MNSKIVTIPIAPHLVKFINEEYDKNAQGIVQIKLRVIPPRDITPKNYRNYFVQPAPDLVYVNVSTIDSRLYKLYGWIKHINQHFSTKMIDYVAARFDLQEASVSIRNFLALYGITESDYAFENAYKKWQRSKAYKKLKSERDRIKCQV